MYLAASKEFRSLKADNIELAKDLHFENQIIIIIIMIIIMITLIIRASCLQSAGQAIIIIIFIQGAHFTKSDIQ